MDVERPIAPKLELVGAEGLRGIFLNTITRRFADAVATKFAEALWKRAPVRTPNDGIDRGARIARPTLVVGYDEALVADNFRGGRRRFAADGMSRARRRTRHKTLLLVRGQSPACLRWAVRHRLRRGARVDRPRFLVGRRPSGIKH